MVTERELKIGDTYFMVTYTEARMHVPIVLTYTYLGKDIEGMNESRAASSAYYFRYLPAFQREVEDTAEHSMEMQYPDLFRGWGEKVPTVFSAEKLPGFHTLDGLIEELTRARHRAASWEKG